MVALDHGLISRARSLTTGENVHRTKELIFAYKQAVALYNEGTSKYHVVFQKQCEDELRQFVKRESGKHAEVSRLKDYRHLDERNQAVMRHAAEAMEKAERLEKRCEELDERVTAALLFYNGEKKNRKDAA